MTFFIYQYGLGDMLFHALMQREGLIGIINFNTVYFSDNRYFQYHDEELRLRIDLLRELGVNVNYMKNHDVRYRVCLTDKVKHVNNFKLHLPLKDNTLGEYIVFHTKLRPAWEILHRAHDIKKMFLSLCREYKSKYKIVVLGERNLKKDLEVDMLHMTTIYDELLLLRENNEVIDLTQDYIIPNYDNLIDNISLIANAKCNICFGHGGAFCLSISFSKLCHAYIDKIDYSHFFNNDALKNNNVFLHNDFTTFTNVISNL